MVLVQKWPFFLHCFQAIQARKMSFTIFYNEKATFQAIKTRTSKNRKIDIFPKGITHGFCSKMAIFPTYFFNAILARKIVFTIFYKVKPTFQAIKTRSLNNRKIIIFSNGLTHGFGPKKAIFCNFFFWPIDARKMSFTIFQNKETSLQDIKTRSLKRRKIDIFFKGVNPWFLVQKSPSFQNFFLGNTGKKNVFYDILERKNTFLGQKSKKFRKVEKLTYFQIGWITHGLGPKMAIFPNFFFRHYRPGKCLL